VEGQGHGWHPDPWRRHRLRYHDGSRWTPSVVDDGDVFEDAAPTADPGDAVGGVDPAPEPSVRAIDGPGIEVPAVGATTGKSYHAFISYSHGEDGDIAAALQRGLIRLAKPWRQRRALEVFRDETSLAANPSLWTTLVGALERSQWLVVLASPKSAASPWVGKEIEHWLQTRGAERILIAHTAGNLRWDVSTGTFTADSDAIHPVLRGAFSEEPLYVDLTWALDPRAELSLRDPRFRRQIAELAAPMHGIDKDELESDDIAMQRRVRLLTRAAGVMLVALTFSSAAAGLLAASQRQEAVGQRDRATAEARTALSQNLAARADASVAERPDRRLLMAAAAERLESTPASRRALLAALLEVDEIQILLPDHANAVIDVHATPDGSRIATVDAAGQLRVWDEAGALVFGPLETGATFARLSPDGTWAVTLDRTGLARWIDLDTGEEHSVELTPGSEQVAIGCNAWGCHPLADLSPDGTLALGVDVDIEAEEWVVRFADRDGSQADVSTTTPVTALAWSDRGTLVVGDFIGLQAWDGPRGPRDDHYGYEFGFGSGVPPGSLAIGDAWDGGEIVAYSAADSEGQPTVLVVGSIDSQGTWHDIDQTSLRPPWEAATSAHEMGRYDHIASVAVANSTVVVGNDARLGGAFRTAMTEVSARSLNQRHLLGSNVPPQAITRLVPAGDQNVVVAGFDEVVRVMGPGNSLISVTSAGPRWESPHFDDWLESLDEDEEPVLGEFPTSPDFVAREEAIDALSALTEDLTPFDAIAHPDDRMLVGLFADSGTIEGASSTGDISREAFRGVPGELRIFDGEEDVTPERLRADRFTAVALSPGGDEILAGTSEGRIDTIDPDTGVVLQTNQVSRSPVLSLELSPDEFWLLATSLEELNLLAADDLGVATTLVATTAQSGALYEAPSLDFVIAGFTEDQSVAFSWVGPLDVIDPENAVGPFGDPPTAETNDQSAALPGLYRGPVGTETYQLVELRLDGLLERACTLVNREITPEEWDRWVGGIPQEPVCPGGPELAAAPEAFLDPWEGSERYVPLAGVTVDPRLEWHPSAEEAVAGYFGATTDASEVYVGSCADDDAGSESKTDGEYCRRRSETNAPAQGAPSPNTILMLEAITSVRVYLVEGEKAPGSECEGFAESCPDHELRWRVHDEWHSDDDIPPPDWVSQTFPGLPAIWSGSTNGETVGDVDNVFVDRND
jgi:WD40 repeat protein